jgi:hypothetical protein
MLHKSLWRFFLILQGEAFSKYLMTFMYFVQDQFWTLFNDIGEVKLTFLKVQVCLKEQTFKGRCLELFVLYKKLKFHV